MTYKDQTQRRDHKYTVRMSDEHGQLIELLAKITGRQKSTVIYNLAIRAAEQEIARITGGAGGQAVGA